MSRKINIVTSSLQALLRQDSDLSDTVNIATHLSKKIEVAVAVLPTTPLLRNVALETVSSGFIHAFELKEVKEDSPLYLSLISSCDLITSLLTHSPTGWCDTIFLWGIDLLLRLSSSSSAQFNSPNEKMEYWMSKPLIKSVVQFVSTSVEYRVNNNNDVINCVLDAVPVHRAELGWLLAHIISIRPIVLVQKLFQYSSSLSSLIVTTMANCLNLLVEGYPHIVQEALLEMVQCIAMTTSDKKIIPSLKLLIQLMLQSSHILELMAKEILQIFTPEHIYNLMTSAVESGLTDGSHDDGEIISGDEGVESMEQDGLQEVPLLSSLLSLLLQLSGSNAVSAINLIVGCVVLCIENGRTEEEEDGEINPHAITKLHLLKATKTLMNDVVLIVSKSVNSVLLNNPLSDSAPLKFTVSLQDGLTYWTTLLAESNDNSLVEFLSQLIASVGICNSEIIAANVLSLFLRKCTNKNLPIFISLHVQYLLQHCGVTVSFISESVSSLRKDNTDIDQWCSNMYQLLMASNDSNSCLKAALPSSIVPIISLLPLTTPTSAITLMSFIRPFIQEFVSIQLLSDTTSVIKQLMDHFFRVLSIIALNIINKGANNSNTEKEYQLCLCRYLIIMFANVNDGVKSFTYSEIFTQITSMDMAGYLILSSHQTEDQRSNPNGLLLSNSHCKFPFIRGSLLNTRQTQHSGSLQKRLTPDPQTDSNSDLHSPRSMAITHSNDHIICLLSEITDKSTDKLASLLMDTAAPSLVIPLGVWPELDFSVTSRQIVEINLNIKRNLDQIPILWKVLLLISTDPRGFMKCSSLIQSLLDTMTSLWRRRRSTHAAIYNNDLKASEILIQSLSQAGWIPRPLCYVSELFNSLISEEVAQLHQLVYQYVKDNYRSISSGCQVPNELDDKTKLSLKSLMIKNIDQFGHVYHRFVLTSL